MEKKNIEYIEVSKLIPYARNAKKHSEEQISSIAASIKEFGFNSPVMIDSDNVIIAGHGRVLASQKLGLEKIPCIRIEHLTNNQIRAYMLTDNRLSEIGGGWDMEMLDIELNDIDWDDFKDFNIEDLGDFDLPDIDNDAADKSTDNKESTYTNKIIAPIYTPKGECPKLNELYDRTKTQSLIEKINATDIPEDIKMFMRMAAERHTVFNFRQIAEYYCHADPVLQDLMEQSGMIIIDFNKAIEYGFVNMTERLGDLANLEDGADDEDE